MLTLLCEIYLSYLSWITSVNVQDRLPCTAECRNRFKCERGLIVREYQTHVRYTTHTLPFPKVSLLDSVSAATMNYTAQKFVVWRRERLKSVDARNRIQVDFSDPILQCFFCGFRALRTLRWILSSFHLRVVCGPASVVVVVVADVVGVSVCVLVCVV